MESTPTLRFDRRRSGGVLALLGVLGFQLYHLYGLHVSSDLPLWDESAYVGWGDQFLQDGMVGSITNSPAYHILYGVVIRSVGLLASVATMQYLLKLVLTALVFALTLRLSRSRALSVFVGVAFAYSNYHIHCDVLVYYGALVPYLAAILVARRAPGLSLGLSFLAGLGRLEYMAVPAIHFVYLLIVRGRTREADKSRWPSALPAVLVWCFNLYVLSCITVWQFHNRVWFAWSQNYAFFRYLTGQDSGGNPWLDHQVIAERDFPGAHSLREALMVNPAGVIEHTWFNLRMLPRYLADFVIATPNAGDWRFIPAWLLAALLVGGGVCLFRIRGVRGRLATGFKGLGDEIVLGLAGVIATLPSAVVSSKTNYIMPLVPVALLSLCVAHRAAKCASRGYARWSSPVFCGLAVALTVGSFWSPQAASTRAGGGPVREDVLAMRRVLLPFYGLKILGVSTASYVNYLGREKGHIFVEPLAISPINRQAEDLSLAGLIRANQPEILLINSHWRSSATYAVAMDGFSFDGWDPHPLRDGVLYTRRGLTMVPEFDGGWHEQETEGGAIWRWSRGDAGIMLTNTIADRPIVISFRIRAIGPREVEIKLNDIAVQRVRLVADSWMTVELPVARLPAGHNRLSFHSDTPAVSPGAGDSRLLDVCVEDFGVRYPPVHLPERVRRRPLW